MWTTHSSRALWVREELINSAPEARRSYLVWVLVNIIHSPVARQQPWAVRVTAAILSVTLLTCCLRCCRDGVWHHGSDSWNDPPGEQGRPWLLPAGNSNELESAKSAMTFRQLGKTTPENRKANRQFVQSINYQLLLWVSVCVNAYKRDRESGGKGRELSHNKGSGELSKAPGDQVHSNDDSLLVWCHHLIHIPVPRCSTPKCQHPLSPAQRDTRRPSDQ